MIQIAVILVCIVLNACLSAFEMGLVSVKRASLRLLAEKGSKTAQEILTMRQSLEKTLSTIQVGITIAAIISGAMVGKLAETWGAPWLHHTWGLRPDLAEYGAIVFLVGLTTYLTVVFAELVPKSIAAKHPSRVSFLFSKAILTLNFIFSPVVRLFELSTLLTVKLFNQFDRGTSASDLDKADEAFDIHRLSGKHREYVQNLINIQKYPIATVVLPWSEVVKIDVTMNSAKVMQKLVNSGHTRVPVLDRGEVVGLLHAKEFLASDTDTWQNLIRPIASVNETARPLTILRMLQKKRSHMCIVVNRDDSEPVGIVTIEDILEQIVGNLYDEDDE